MWTHLGLVAAVTNRKWRDWFGTHGDSERVVFRIIHEIINWELDGGDEISKSEILKRFRQNPSIVHAFREHGLSPTEAGDGMHTSQNMVDWYDSRYTRWHEHEEYFSGLIRTDRDGNRFYSPGHEDARSSLR